jgi:uncharacterized protein YecA (UPF0149 family)
MALATGRSSPLSAASCTRSTRKAPLAPPAEHKPGYSEGRGFFALLIYLGLIAFGWHAPALPTVPHGRPVGRNDPCPCGSGHKYKRCCLA